LGIFDKFKQPDLPKPNAPNTNSNVRELEHILGKWLNSKTRDEQLLAEKYYSGHHDILEREKKVIGADGQLVTIDNVANNKLIDNQYRKLVDQKTNYVLGKPLTIATSDDEYLQLLGKVFTKKLHRQLRVLTQYAVDGGVAWLYPYLNKDGEFKIMVFPSYEICPIWKDKGHTELAGAMRYYPEDVFDKKGGIQTIYHVDLFTTDGITHYRYQGASLILDDNPHSDYMYVGDKGFNWNRLPIIPFKYNSKEIPLIRNVKSLQDSLNQVLSDFQNNMEEDPRTTILVLKNYDGTNIAEFRKNLATYGVIKVTTVDGVQGGVDTLKVEVNAQNYQAILMQLKRAIVENGRGFDAKEERMDGDPNQMNIESMYTDIDLDVNAMETEFQAGFEELKWFIDHYLINNGKADYSDEDVDFVFNRDIFINEDAKIDNCVKSVGVISNKTILARHPWVTNVEHELKQIEEDKQAELEEMETMQAFQVQNNPNQAASKNNKKDDNSKSGDK
jgi:SPP1 family phage portal protein